MLNFLTFTNYLKQNLAKKQQLAFAITNFYPLLWLNINEKKIWSFCNGWKTFYVHMLGYCILLFHCYGVVSPSCGSSYQHIEDIYLLSTLGCGVTFLRKSLSTHKIYLFTFIPRMWCSFLATVLINTEKVFLNFNSINKWLEPRFSFWR